MSSAALHALLDGLVDYAGLFPPAALPMADAVANYAAYRAGAEAPALGRFVLPVARLGEFETVAACFIGRKPWRLSVLAQPDDAAAIRAFNARQSGRAVIDTVETRGRAERDVAALAPLATIGPVFVEIPVHDDPDAMVRSIGAHRLRAKIRTGGVTPDAFPTPAHVVRFLGACVRHDVPFKATAGLHHPLCGEYPLTYAAQSARGAMFGFLNVFLAALLLRQGMCEVEAVQLLEERNPAAIRFTPAGVHWRAHSLSADALTAGRARLALSFGSCSFREPLDDLSALRLT